MFNTTFTIAGLNSQVITIPVAGLYSFDGKIELPTLSQGAVANSAVVMTITNATGPVTILTTSAGRDGFKVDTVCAAGDAITFALTSGAAVDQGLNNIKATVAISLGV